LFEKAAAGDNTIEKKTGARVNKRRSTRGDQAVVLGASRLNRRKGKKKAKYERGYAHHRFSARRGITLGSLGKKVKKRTRS